MILNLDFGLIEIVGGCAQPQGDIPETEQRPTLVPGGKFAGRVTASFLAHRVEGVSGTELRKRCMRMSLRYQGSEPNCVA